MRAVSRGVRINDRTAAEQVGDRADAEHRNAGRVRRDGGLERYAGVAAEPLTISASTDIREC